MNIANMKMIIIDDNPNNVMIVEAYGKNLGLNTKGFVNPIEAIEFLRFNKCDIVIVDFMMPQMNGLDFIKEFKNIDDVSPIIMLTAVADDSNLHLKALEYGATDFISKPISGAIFKNRVINLLKLKKSYEIIYDKAQIFANEVKKATKVIEEREYETIRIIGKASEYKDQETAAHVSRVANISRLLAKAMNLDEKTQDLIYKASNFHDLGKIGIPDNILLKPASLENSEWETMKTHTSIGYEILKNSKSDYLRAGGIIAFTHHEKYDGSGYPNGLKGENIPLMGRIVAIADVFDALMSKRPYKDPWTLEMSKEYLINAKGIHFDPRLIELFMENILSVTEIMNTIKD